MLPSYKVQTDYTDSLFLFIFFREMFFVRISNILE